MEQSIGMSDAAKLAVTAAGMSLAANMTKTAGTAADGQFQKLLEKVKMTENTAQSKDTKQDVPQQKDTAVKSEQSQAEDSSPKTETPEEAAGPDAVDEAKEAAKRVLESGILADGVFVPQDVVQDVAEDTPQKPGDSVLSVMEVETDTGDVEQMAESQLPVDAPAESEDVPVEEDQPEETEQIELETKPDRQVHTERQESAPEQVERPEEQAETSEDDMEVQVTDHDGGAQPLFHDVKAAPIKVGESVQTEEVGAEDVSGQIAGQLIPAMEQGETRVELQLTPEHLGTVKIEITQSENGALHVAISAQSSQTKNLLEKHSDSLQAMLASRSQTTVRVEVQRQEESQPKNPYDGHNSQNPQQQQQEGQHKPRHSQNSQDFMHQLRLGLVGVQDEA